MSFTIKRMLYSSFPQTYLLNKINWYNLDTFSNLIPQVSFISNSFYDEEENISSLLSKLLEKQFNDCQVNSTELAELAESTENHNFLSSLIKQLNNYP